uniref:Alpha/beta hydrolase n=1 Tax=uncultured bacterium 20 TaxID=1748270 RepID=A0A0U3UHS8_9BACT|nr:alpha/beta hydrolase [uncultured bacterium 20]
MTVGAARLGLPGTARATSGETSPADRAADGARPNRRFGAMKPIDAGLLSVSYAEEGPANGAPRPDAKVYAA